MARFDRRKIFKHLILTYIIFQTFYILFHRWLAAEPLDIQYTVPYWLMWYLLTVIFFYILIPMLPERNSRWVLPALVISVFIALIAGYMENVGYYMSLARVFYLFPFFIGGYYYDILLEKWVGNICIKLGIGALCLGMIIFGEKYICRGTFTNGALYGAYSYSTSSSTIIDRILIMMTALCWILLFEILIPDRKIPFVSTIGQNTMPIYLLHGFVVRYTFYRGIFHFSQKTNLLLACGLAVVMIIIFGNKYVGKIFKTLL